MTKEAKAREKAFITLLILLVLSSILAGIFWFCQNVMCFLILVSIISFIIGGLIKLFVTGVNKLDANNILMIVLAFIGLFLSCIIPIAEPSIKEQFDRLYFPKDSINISNDIIKPITSNSIQHKLIFAFDNSKEGFNNIVSDNYLKEEYNKYREEIMDFCGILSTELLPSTNTTRLTYGKLMKARLAFDLIQMKDSSAEFIIMKIGDPKFSYDKNQFLFANDKFIKEEIKRLLNTDNQEEWTDFESFLDKLEIKIKDNAKKRENTLSDYAVYVYSDFYHDIYGEETDEQINILKQRLKSDLFTTVVHICFIDGHLEHKNTGGKYLLDHIPTSWYERHFFINKINVNEIIPTRLAKTSKIFWFYSKNNEVDIDIEYKLLFNHNDYKICLLDSINGYSINEKSMKHNVWESFNFNKSIILRYKGNVPKEGCIVNFEISHNKIHYLLPFQFYQEWDYGNIPLIIAILFGFILGIWGIKKKYDNNNH